MVAYWAWFAAGTCCGMALLVLGLVIGYVAGESDGRKLQSGQPIFEPSRSYGPRGEM